MKDTFNNCLLLEFFENELLLCSENVPLARRGWLWIQRDRVRPYSGREVVEYLNKNYQLRYMGKDGELAWTTLWPNLNLVRFLFVVIHKF